MRRSRDTWLWPADNVLPEDGPVDSPGYVTDVFERYSKPRMGSLLLAVGLRGYPNEREAVIAVGVVRSIQPVATFKDRLRIEPIFHLPEIPIEQLPPLRYLDPGRVSARSSASGAPWGESHDSIVERPLRLSDSVATEVTAILVRIYPELAGFLDAVDTGEESIAGPRGAQLREERDAIALAAELAGIDVPDSHLDSRELPSGPLTSLISPAVVMENEDDILAEDLRRFDALGSIRLQHSAITQFQDEKFRLTIMNVNRKPLEHVLGVDLIYIDEVQESFTLVQYKRLTKHGLKKGDRSGERWKYTRESDLTKQLELMQLGDARTAPARARDFRMASSPFWFKFVKEEVFRPNDRMVIRGMYVPADYLGLAIADESLRTGPNGGFEVTYSNARYVRRDTFIDLTRRGLLGSTTIETDKILRIVERLSDDREVVVSVRSARNTRL